MLVLYLSCPNYYSQGTHICWLSHYRRFAVVYIEDLVVVYIGNSRTSVTASCTTTTITTTARCYWIPRGKQSQSEQWDAHAHAPTHTYVHSRTPTGYCNACYVDILYFVPFSVLCVLLMVYVGNGGQGTLTFSCPPAPPSTRQPGARVCGGNGNLPEAPPPACPASCRLALTAQLGKCVRVFK